ncbi:tetraspanin family domain-containing protein [Phthorimaea operculella]|nr:tetraspanin family domain-containing protein [Phthorimaea operculella]
MSGKTGRTSKFAAAVLLGINFIVMFFCAILFAFALWMISSPSTLSAAIHGFGSPSVKALLPPEILTLQLGIGSAALATFFFFVAFMGLYGAVSRSQFLLFMYATLIVLLLLLECALLFYFSSSLLEKGLQEQDGQWTHALRLVFKCCERNATTYQEGSKLPWSCCGPEGYPSNCTIFSIFSKNCNTTIASFLHRYNTGFYASITVLHIMLCTSSTPPRKASWHAARVAPVAAAVEPSNDDVLMVVLGRGRIGWVEPSASIKIQPR